MQNRLKNEFELISKEEKINEFVKNNTETLKILKAMKPLLQKHFSKKKLSLEVCDDLKWTSETKLLLNVHVTEEMFFNGMLSHFINIYREIEPIIENIMCPVVLFLYPNNEKYEKMEIIVQLTLLPEQLISIMI